MKTSHDDSVIREAQTGFLSKDEYRNFQNCLITDKNLAAKVQEILIAEMIPFGLPDYPDEPF